LDRDPARPRSGAVSLGSDLKEPQGGKGGPLVRTILGRMTTLRLQRAGECGGLEDDDNHQQEDDNDQGDEITRKTKEKRIN